MKIFFVNHNHCPILVEVNNKIIKLNSFERKPLEICENNLEICLNHSYESFVPKNSNIYNLVINSKFKIVNIMDGETFNINREKIRFSAEACYDRFFLLTQDALITSESHVVSAEEKIKKHIKRAKVVNRLLIAPLEQSTGLLILGIIIGCALSYFIGWRFTIVYFPILYVILVLFNWIIDGIWDLIGKKAFNDKNQKNLDLYFEEAFIKNYYSNPSREPFMGNIEIN